MMGEYRSAFKTERGAIAWFRRGGGGDTALSAAAAATAASERQACGVSPVAMNLGPSECAALAVWMVSGRAYRDTPAAAIG
jgi:hypothetical protein